MFWFKTGVHIIALCIGCLMEWFPGRSVEWLESRLDYYADHLDYKLAKANKRSDDPEPRLEDFARFPVRDDDTGRWSERVKAS